DYYCCSYAGSYTYIF
nr:immunoglobulin light chain junction region [Macaca mulatta]MOW31592.1 immunoglobulin light chain junction region [Macaca mulatta]MOW59886.1 immunoglobulin light chain junction region [Macaca mulatta]